MNKLREGLVKAKATAKVFTNKVAGRVKRMDKNAPFTVAGIACVCVAGFIVAAWVGFLVTGAFLIAIGERG